MALDLELFTFVFFAIDWGKINWMCMEEEAAGKEGGKGDEDKEEEDGGGEEDREGTWIQTIRVFAVPLPDKEMAIGATSR